MRSIIVAISTLLVAGTAAAGTVHGTVYPGEAQSGEPAFWDGCFWRLGPDIGSTGAQMPLFVVLEGEAARGAKAPSRSPQTIQIEGYEFWPSVVSVQAGSTLTIKNSSPHLQSCFASGPNGFQFSDLKTGGKHEHRFLSAGTVEIRCHLYPFMQATVVVTESPLVTEVDDSGRYSFQRIPAGEYQAKVYADGHWRWTRDVKIPSGGLVEVDLGPNVAAAAPRKDAQETSIPEKKPVEEKEVSSVKEAAPPKVTAPGLKKPPAEKKRPPRKVKKHEAKPVFEDVEPVIEPEKKPPPKKKPPAVKKRPPKKKDQSKPVFKDVELEIEIVEE